MKKRSLALGILLGIAVVTSMGIVYIDSIKHYFYTAGGLVQMVVNTNYVFGVDTNTQRIGIFSTNTTFAIEILPRQPSTNAAATGQSSAAIGGMNFQAAKGGDSIRGTTATGGAGGAINITGGDGGEASFAQTNYTGGGGGGFAVLGGTGGGAAAGIASNNITGGNGGAFSLTSGPGGSPATPATNAVGGNGGTITITASAGGTPTAGWARKTGSGGQLIFNGGSSGNSVRTNTGNGGAISFSAGSSGNVTTSPGDPGNAGNLNFTAGNGGSGGTNANGGSQYFLPGTGAITGNIVIGRDVTGVSRGGLMVGPLISGGSVSITNVLGGSAALDFGSVAAGAVEDLPIAVTGVTSNNCAVSLSVPWESASGGGAFVTFNSNDVIYVRFVNNQLVAAIDPTPGTFTVVAFRIR